MSPALMKMWISLIGIGMMFLSVLFIVISRYKIKRRFLKVITAIIAYGFMIYAGVIMILVVFSGPTTE
ncbi:DUF2768 domain-containing protein [Fervidibacillus halotolerans]|uniref:DUF2768 domain-containing protein n=1 Tax=Fervidibacillus halotolerans TaxID=2980027 RepID=A0A9E8S023_9BACI|nr:DUF2768 domain-containing protein [Fervidibacillus halotolerans]WAA13769.1 DUF2768 domain-containing protein [Fervidibacillus halotolerans]